MITPEQSETIVKACVEGTVGDADGYKADKPLDLLGIKTKEFLNTFKKMIRSDEQRGVKSVGHTLLAAELDTVDINTEAGDVENIIFIKAKPAKKAKSVKKAKEIKL